jgi:hypothetical protein
MKVKFIVFLGFLLLSFSCRSILVKVFFTNSLLIDTGFRVEENHSTDNPIIVAGTEINKVIDFYGTKKFDCDEELFISLNNYFHNRLTVVYKKFKNQNTRDISRNYPNFNTENMLLYGFYYGCTDICALIGSVLINNGYNCKFVFTVCEEFSESLHKNYGHTYLYIEKGNKSFLYDPAMSRQIFEGYKIGTPRLSVKSLVGDQFIYAIHDFPGKLDMQTFNYELDLRIKAYRYWKSQN